MHKRTVICHTVRTLNVRSSIRGAYLNSSLRADGCCSPSAAELSLWWTKPNACKTPKENADTYKKLHTPAVPAAVHRRRVGNIGLRDCTSLNSMQSPTVENEWTSFHCQMPHSGSLESVIAVPRWCIGRVLSVRG